MARLVKTELLFLMVMFMASAARIYCGPLSSKSSSALHSSSSSAYAAAAPLVWASLFAWFVWPSSKGLLSPEPSSKSPAMLRIA